MTDEHSGYRGWADQKLDAREAQLTQPRLPSQHDVLAVASFVLTFFALPLGFILSLVSVHAAHRDGHDASGLAVAGVIIGGSLLSLLILVVILTPSIPL